MFSSWQFLACLALLHPVAVSFVLRVHRAVPVVNLLLGVLFVYSVSLLNFAHQLVLLAFDHLEIAIGQLAPAGADFTFHLLPLAFYLVPIHAILLKFVPLRAYRLSV